MVAEKLLFIFVIAVAIILVYFVFISALTPKYTRVIDEGLQAFAEAGKCSIGFADQISGNDCGLRIGELECSQSNSCVWCSGKINTQTVSVCGPKICGCGLGLESSTGRIMFFLDKDIYNAGDSIRLSGRAGESYSSGEYPEVTVSFLGPDRNPLSSFGEEAVMHPNDRGNYEQIFHIPEDLRMRGVSDYFLSVRYDGNSEFLKFSVSEVSEKEASELEKEIEKELEKEIEKELEKEIEKELEKEIEKEEPIEADVPATELKEGAATVRVLLIQFGNYMTDTEMKELQVFLKSAMTDAVEGNIELDIEYGGSVPLPPPSPDHNYRSVRNKWVWIEDESLDRVWYYDIGKSYLKSDVESAIIRSGYSSGRHDLAVVLSEAQFESLAFFDVYSHQTQSGLVSIPVVMVEQPREIAFGIEKRHRTERNNLYSLSDEIIHEVGHYLGLDHACDPRTCSGCRWRDDVMSYCRDRLSGDEMHYNKFSSCTLDFIEESSVPAIKQGLLIPKQGPKCRS